mmetsp:Transcript_5764/g.9590  ORF Transcript_5764/g.9590 Transcript_5764/m.9590 type:complete len:140 (-) Transcript_5764:84-503(-)
MLYIHTANSVDHIRVEHIHPFSNLFFSLYQPNKLQSRMLKLANIFRNTSLYCSSPTTDPPVVDPTTPIFSSSSPMTGSLRGMLNVIKRSVSTFFNLSAHNSTSIQCAALLSLVVEVVVLPFFVLPWITFCDPLARHTCN